MASDSVTIMPFVGRACYWDSQNPSAAANNSPANINNVAQSSLSIVPLDFELCHHFVITTSLDFQSNFLVNVLG